MDCEKLTGDKKEKLLTSNSLVLSPREWPAFLALLVLVVILLPVVWRMAERTALREPFRIADRLNEDYWVFTSVAERVAARYPVVVLGDSHVWGRFVQNGETLPDRLNAKFGAPRFGNLGVNGLHDAALFGLVKYYGGPIRGKKVILALNPVWFNSIDEDLRGENEKRINQPRLIPQFDGRIRSYREKLPAKLGIVAERAIPFFALMNHVRTCCFSGREMSDWVLANPGKNPLPLLSFRVDATQGTNATKTFKLYPQNWDWIDLADSLQFQFFTDTIRLLRARGNDLFVYVVPINPSILSKESLDLYRALQSQVRDALEAEKVPFYLCPDLPKPLYADASHPLAKGYDRIAEMMSRDAVFRKWLDGR